MGFFDAIFAKQIPPTALTSPVAGVAVPLCEIADPAFSGGLLGKGAAVIPSANRITAPCGGLVDTVYDNGHAVSLISDFGAQVLIHIGLHTVSAPASLFDVAVTAGQTVRRGQLLVTFDREGLQGAGFDITTPVVVCNSDDFSKCQPKTGSVTPDDCLLELAK